MSELKPTTEESIRHFEAQQKRYVREHNGKPCPHYANAIDALRRAQPANEPLMRDCVEEAPTADVAQVVRCKDCKHNGTWQCHMEYDEYYPEADIHREMHGDDDFCSYGVKEDGESNDE